MSYFARVENGRVIQVIVAEQEFIDRLTDGVWVQTSYNTKGNIHYSPTTNEPDGGVALRGNYAGVGFVYDQQNDVFYRPQPYPSWVLNQQTWTWDAPVPKPNDGEFYGWDEETVSWIKLVPPDIPN